MSFNPNKPVQTRDGRPARIICTDMEGGAYSIVAIVTTTGQEHAETFTSAGTYRYEPGHANDARDLVNVPVVTVEYVNYFNEKAPTVYTQLEPASSDIDKRSADFAGRIKVTLHDGKLFSAEVMPC